MRTLLVIACLLLPAGSALAAEGPVYQRQRHDGGRFGGFGGYSYGQPYYGGFYSPPTIYGSYYTRPYPTHLDYFRLRGTPVPDCPCADVVPTLPEQGPGVATPGL
jgi:hypothetical protein